MENRAPIKGRPMTRDEFRAMVEARRKRFAESQGKTVETRKERIENRHHRRPGFVPRTEK